MKRALLLLLLGWPGLAWAVAAQLGPANNVARTPGASGDVAAWRWTCCLDLTENGCDTATRTDSCEDGDWVGPFDCTGKGDLKVQLAVPAVDVNAAELTVRAFDCEDPLPSPAGLGDVTPLSEPTCSELTSGLFVGVNLSTGDSDGVPARRLIERVSTGQFRFLMFLLDCVGGCDELDARVRCQR